MGENGYERTADTEATAPEVYSRLFAVMQQHQCLVELLRTAVNRGWVHKRIDTLQMVGFRCFSAITTVSCSPITLIIGRNNTGKTNLLESFRLTTIEGLLGLIDEFRTSFGSQGTMGNLEFFHSRDSENGYYPSPLRLAVKTNALVMGIVIYRFAPYIRIEQYRNNLLLWTLDAADDFSKFTIHWGSDQPPKPDARKFSMKFPLDKNDPILLALKESSGETRRVAYHRCWKDDRVLVDELEVRLSVLSHEEARQFLEKVCSRFSLPGLEHLRIRFSNLAFLPTPHELQQRKASLEELTGLKKHLKSWEGFSPRKHLTKQVVAKIDELIERYDPKPKQMDRPGSGGLTVSEDRSLAKSLGSGFRALLLLCFEIETNDLILIDEPESFLHSRLQLQLAQYLLEETECGKQFVIASHSEVFLNALFGNESCAVVEAEKHVSTRVIRTVASSAQLSKIISDLGLRASALLQANCLIWVEGPSDRLYISRWIELWSNGHYKEGVHFQCVCYGGRVLSHYTLDEDLGSDADLEARISMLRINRHAIVVLDSDRSLPSDGLNNTKLRLLSEVEKAGGYSWVSTGRTIENYLPTNLLNDAGIDFAAGFNHHSSIDQYLKDSRTSVRPRGKVDLARRVLSAMTRTDIEQNPALSSKLAMVCMYLDRWN